MDINEKKDLDVLIDGPILESDKLEYKAAASITDQDEIGKDVSAMANADGGTIIYGMFSSKGIPTAIDPVKTKKGEYLDQVIANQIMPKLVCQIKQIPVDDGLVFVVNVPRGETAHQAKFDMRYHRRRSLVTEWMADYEIRDVMNRAKHPKVIVRFAITMGDIHAWLYNEGDVIAIHIRCVLRISGFILRDIQRDAPELHRDFKDVGILHAGADDIPLGAFALENEARQDIYWGTTDSKVLDAPITWKVWADNAVTEGITRIREIRVTDMNS